LISPKNDDSMNSTFGNRPDQDRATAVLYMHSEDAAARGIASGDLVRAFNSRGSIVLNAQVNGAVSRGVVSAPSTRWPKLAPDRSNVNMLTSERLTDAGGGPTFYSCLVEVTRCGD
jgi:anaerobic selenocysteine-containing dehydrogenase